MSNSESWHNVGKKIRHLRKAHQLTIKQLAAGCDLSPNAISLLERGEVAPTVATLCKIASALGAPASAFFREVCPNEIVLTRAHDHLAHHPTSRALTALSCAITPPPQPADAPEESACSPEYVLCLTGAIEYEVDGQSFRLNPGDSVSFNSSVLHNWRNCGHGPALAVMILYPEKEPAP